jgi:hypothetical protein
MNYLYEKHQIKLNSNCKNLVCDKFDAKDMKIDFQNGLDKQQTKILFRQF